MTTICVECNESFEREKKRGRPATRCPACRGVASTVIPKSESESIPAPVTPKPVPKAETKAPTTKWTTFECPTCKYQTVQLSVATQVMCIRGHLKAVVMKPVEG